jgi:predicted Zn finger-like uncharacterized protein
MIEIKCPRCETHYHVPPEKAGKKGRCPKCGGAIRVPAPDHQVHAQYVPEQTFTPWQKRLMIGVPCAIALLIVVLVLVQGNGGKGKKGEDPETSEAANKVRQADAELARLEDLTERFERYCAKLGQERRLRARSVLEKDRSYEAVTPGEYQLRTEVIEDRARAQAAPASYKEEEWRLDTALTEDEEALLAKLSPQLDMEAKEIARLVARTGGANVLAKDALGREVVSMEDARKEFLARSKAINERRAKAEEELRELRRGR